MDNKKVLYWKNILSAALVLGGLYVLQLFMGYWLRNVETTMFAWLINLYGFVVIVWSLLFFGRRARDIKDDQGLGFSFAQAFGFSLQVLVFSGIIVGFGQWFLQNIVDPAYYTQVYTKSLELMTQGMTTEQVNIAKGSLDIMKSIWGMVFSMVFSMLMLGGLVALGTSVMLKRGPRMVD